MAAMVRITVGRSQMPGAISSFHSTRATTRSIPGRPSWCSRSSPCGPILTGPIIRGTRVWTHKMNVNGGSNGTEQQGRTRKAGFCPVERSDEAGQRHLTVLKGYDRFTWLQRCKTLKTGRFPSVFRLVSNQIGSYHLHAFYRSTP